MDFLCCLQCADQWIEGVSQKHAKGKESLRKFNILEIGRLVPITVSESFNFGRNQGAKVDLIELAQYSAVLDNVTCPLCRFMDKKIIQVDNPDFQKFTPPIHANCRCIWVMLNPKQAGQASVTWERPPQELIDRHGQLVNV